MNINKYLIYILINQFPISLFLIWWKPGMVEVSSQGALFHCAQKSSLTLIFTRDTQYLCVLKLKRLPASYWLEKRNIHYYQLSISCKYSGLASSPPPSLHCLPPISGLLVTFSMKCKYSKSLFNIYIYIFPEWVKIHLYYRLVNFTKNTKPRMRFDVMAINHIQ